jgi:sialic acid synthase SpsE
MQDRTEDLARVLKTQDKYNNNRELTLKIGDIWGKRPGTGVPSRFIEKYIGKTLKRDVAQNTLLADEDFA